MHITHKRNCDVMHLGQHIGLMFRVQYFFAFIFVALVNVFN